MIVSILLFLIMIGVIVTVHELGHFAMARRSGIKVKEFDLGMGPTLFSKKWGETDFCVKMLPIGGACIFEGMEDADADIESLPEGAFQKAPVGGRIATVLGGPAFNVILGFVISLILVAFTGTDLPVIDKVMENSAAQEAGLMAGDRIVSLNGERIHLYREISLVTTLTYGAPLDIVYERDGEKKEVHLEPRYDEETGRYLIGVQRSAQTHKCSVPELFLYSGYEVEYWVRYTLKSLGTLFNGHFSPDSVSGPVGIVQVVDETYEQTKPYGAFVTIMSLLNLATLFTINLGIINLLPLPALDGGRLIFLLIELISGKRVPPEKEGMVHLAGFAMLMMLMVLVLFNDIARFFR